MTMRVGLPCQQTPVLRPARVSVMDENSEVLRDTRPESPFLTSSTFLQPSKPSRGAPTHGSPKTSPALDHEGKDTKAAALRKLQVRSTT